MTLALADVPYIPFGESDLTHVAYGSISAYPFPAIVSGLASSGRRRWPDMLLSIYRAGRVCRLELMALLTSLSAQAAGMVNDHLVTCHCHPDCAPAKPAADRRHSPGKTAS